MKNRMLIFSHEFPPDLGGIGVVAYQYADYFSSQGYKVDVLTSKKNEIQKFEKFNVIYNEISTKFWFLGYRKIVDFDKYDLIFLNDPSTIYAAGLFFTKAQLKKSICFLHGSEPERVYEKQTLFRKLSFFKYFFNKALLNSKVIISPSCYMKEKFLTSCNLNNLENKIEIVYYGIDCDLFFSNKDNISKSSLDIKEEQEVLISVSRITKQKGYLNKYNIFKKLVNEYKKDLVWIIIGDGEYLQELKKLVKCDNLENRVLLLGKKDRKELLHYYHISDLFWLLSEYKESFGLVYVEAQLCGLPAIGNNNNSGVEEAILNHETGYLVNSEEELIDIIVNKKYLDIKVNDVVSFAKKFDIKNQTNSLIRIMSEY